MEKYVFVCVTSSCPSPLKIKRKLHLRKGKGSKIVFRVMKSYTMPCGGMLLPDDVLSVMVALFGTKKCRVFNTGKNIVVPSRIST